MDRRTSPLVASWFGRLVITVVSVGATACASGARPLAPRDPSICAKDQDVTTRAERYPCSVEESRHRRREERSDAILAAVIALPLGAVLTAAAMYGDSPPPDGDGVLDRFEDSAKDAGGRLLLGAAGMAAVLGGVGLLSLGVLDRWFPDPYVIRRDGRSVLVDPEGPPSGALQLDAYLRTNTAWLRPELEAGLGVSGWLSPHWRLRSTVGPTLASPLTDEAGFVGVSLGVQADWNPGRRAGFGRLPNNALTVYAAPRALWLVADPSEGTARRRAVAAGWRAGLGWTRPGGTFAVGASQIVGHDDMPLVEISYWMAFSL